jgi:hypothetical protein
VDAFREINLRVHGLVLWDDDLPQIDSHEEILDRMQGREASASVFAGAR